MSVRCAPLPRNDGARGNAIVNRVERHALATLGGLLVLESTLGRMLERVASARAPTFLIDTMLGALVLAFAFAVEPTGSSRR